MAFAGFYRDPAAADRAEVAFAVSDALQGHGIGMRMLERLASVARDQGIQTFDAYVLGENRRMLDLFRDSGFAATTDASTADVYHVTLSLSVTTRLRREGRRAIAGGSRGVDEGVLRATRRRRRRREPRARQDRLRDSAQPRRCRVHRRDRARPPVGQRDRRTARPTRASRTSRAPSISR